MKTLRQYLLPACFFCAALTLPSLAAAASGQTSHFKFNGLDANAFFDSVEGCVETEAFPSAFSSLTKTVGRPQTTPGVAVFLIELDNCSFTVLMSAFGSTDLPAGAFQVKGNLLSATLNASFDVFDSVSNTTFPVEISLSWTGTGTLTVSRNHSIFTAPGLREISMSTGAFRAATASGSVTALGINFSPSPTGAAELDSNKEGDLTITHPSH